MNDNINLAPFALCAFGWCLGLLIGEQRGALIGLTLTLGICLAATFLAKSERKP